MAISKTQPMRPAEIELINTLNQLDSDFAALPKIEYGSYDIQVPANGNITAGITFDEQKANAPIVLAVISSSENTISIPEAYMQYYDVSNTGFYFAAFNPNQYAAADLRINWIAIGG